MLVKIITIVLKNTYTTDDLVERLGAMRQYYGDLVFRERKREPGRAVVAWEGYGSYTQQAVTAWHEAFRAAGIGPLVVYEALDAIEQELTGVPSVVLYVPIRFDHATEEGFGRWFREHVQPNMLLTIRTDPRAVGGCSFFWGGRHFDLSLHYFMERRRAELTALLAQEAIPV